MMAIAMARSNALPRLGRLAGTRLTVIFESGQCSPLLMIAALIRSRVSRSAVSGSPRRTVAGRPVVTSAATVTGCPSVPVSATVWVCAVISPPP
jgi:hypothetical protein